MSPAISHFAWRTVLILGCLFASADIARGWDVKCTVSPGGPECKDPFERVRTPWRDDPLAEHGTLLKISISYSGLPLTLLDPFDLTIYAGANSVSTPAGDQYPSVNPVIDGVARTATRTVYIQGMANLPDFAYTLADWSSGNENCLPDPGNPDPFDCHNYETHIGWLNSNHMLPQSRKWYEHLHRIALDVAARCHDSFFSTPPAHRGRFETYFLACEKLALSIEGVAHHYLQDSWAVGHMWERWGSTEIADFSARRSVGFAVAGFVGLLHGGKAMLDTKPPTDNLAPWDDPLSAPHADVFYSDGGLVSAGIGDQFLADLLNLPNDPYQAQRRALFGCAVDGLRAVYDATAKVHGPLQPAATGNFDASRSVASNNCWSQRATNRAMAAGMGVHQGAFPNQIRLTAPYTMDALIWALADQLPNLSGHPELAMTPQDKEQFRTSASAAATLAALAGMDPALANDITVASGAMPPLAGIARNGTYARGNAAAKVAPSAYADPFPPWRVKEPNLSIARRSVPLNLTFADANAADRCGELATSDLEKLRDAVSDGRAAGLPSDQLAARCGRCVQLLAPHLRFGVSGTHDPRREAYCALAVPGSTEFVYNGETTPFTGQEPDDFASLQATARDVCRCADAIKVAGGTLRNAASGVVGTAFIVKLRQPDGTPLTAAASVSIQGPAGWNNGQLAVLSYPAGFLRQFYGLVAAPVAGAYTASVTVGGALYTATFNVAISTVLASPGAVFPDLTMPGMVGSSWSAVPGAASYLTRVFDVTNNLILAPVAFTTATNAALNGVSLANASTKALQVWAFSNDMTVADPPMPAAFNLAFDRTFISASVTVSPATISVSPSQVVNLTASVSGLANTAVTWTGATATGPNTAQFTAPSNSGTFSATATSVANSAFKGTSRITVSGGTTQCLPWLNMGGFWQVAGFGFHQNCSTHAPFAAFLNGGTISLPTSAAAGEVALSNGLQSYQGTYSCGAGSLFFTSNVSGNATIGMDDSDPSMINVHLILRDPAIPGLVPCTAELQGVR